MLRILQAGADRSHCSGMPVLFHCHAETLRRYRFSKRCATGKAVSLHCLLHTMPSYLLPVETSNMRPYVRQNCLVQPMAPCSVPKSSFSFSLRFNQFSTFPSLMEDSKTDTFHTMSDTSDLPNCKNCLPLCHCHNFQFQTLLRLISYDAKSRCGCKNLHGLRTRSPRSSSQGTPQVLRTLSYPESPCSAWRP